MTSQCVHVIDSCGYYSRVMSIRSALMIVGALFEGGDYLRVASVQRNMVYVCGSEACA